MLWFDKQRGDLPARAAYEALSAAWEKSGLPEAIARVCGPPGLRRFVLRFEETPRGFRVTGVQSEAVKGGGGPPPPQASSAALPDVERAIAALRKGLPSPFRFDRGAIGVIRDSEGPLDITLRLDEDGDRFRLGELRAPRGAGVPVDDPGYLKSLATWSEQANRVRGGWKMCRGGQSFALDGHRLTITTEGRSPEEPPTSESMVVTVLGTWDGRHDRYTWLTDKPVAPEAPFVEPELTLTLGQVTELVAFAAARLGALGVFQGDTDDAGITVFAAVR